MQQHKQIESYARICLIQSPVDSKQIEEKQDCRERKKSLHLKFEIYLLLLASIIQT